METGVYKIAIKGKKYFYVGSSTNIHKRKAEHLRLLKKNEHANKKLQNIFNKYGENVFCFSVLENCEKENLIQREQFYIDLLKPTVNICKKASSTLGIKFKRSDAFKRKVSESKKGVKRGYRVKIYRGSENIQSKKIKRIDQEGRIFLYGSLSEVNNDGFIFQNVWRAIKKEQKHKGYRWYYAD